MVVTEVIIGAGTITSSILVIDVNGASIVGNSVLICGVAVVILDIVNSANVERRNV
jgi:hypothetical protein